MQLLFSLLPFLLRLTLVLQGPAAEAIEISPSDLITFSEGINQNTHNHYIFSSKPSLPPSARKLETEEKEFELFDLFIDSSFYSTTFYSIRDLSLSYFDYRKTRNNPHLYDLFHSWKTHLS